MRIAMLLFTLSAGVPALANPPPGEPDGGSPGADGGVSPEDQKLLEEIQAATQPPPSKEAAPAQGGSKATNFFSNVFNPAMSVNGLFLGSATTQQHPAEDQVHTGIQVQEVEVQILSNVDPFFSANVILSVPGGEGLEVEEGYVSLTPQPAGLSFRGGKIKVPFGRENSVHTHALPFIDKSLVGTAVFGEEGLNEVGMEGSYLAPLPFYTLLTVSLLNGDNELLFASPIDRDLAGFAGLKSVIDLWDDATLEAGLSYTAGGNPGGTLSQVGGGHLVFKWKPARESRTRSAVVALEGMYAGRPASGVEAEPPAPPRTSGFYAYAQWQLAQQWFAVGRFEYLQAWGVDPGVMDQTMRQSLTLVFAPTEFSALRLQANVTEPPGGGPPILDGLLQVNFTLGAHPAHAY